MSWRNKPAGRPHPGLVLFLAVVAGSAALFRMAEAFAPWDANPYGASHHYEYLTEGMLSGHTYLSMPPSPELLRLSDPIAQNGTVARKLIDASLYGGRYYLYFGPTPVLLLMGPWRLVTGHMLPQRMAVAVAASAGLAALARLLWEIRRRHFPEASTAALVCAFIVAMHASWLPVVVRRPYFWELAIVSAVACLWWGLYFLWKFHDSGGRWGWAAASGAAFGFCMGARVSCVVAVAAALLFLGASVYRQGQPARRPWGAWALAALLMGAMGAGLLGYNRARFGRWLEFGATYQIAGDDYRGKAMFSPRYAPFNLRYYLLFAGPLSPYFPFVSPAFPEGSPDQYTGGDDVHGALAAVPAQLIGLAAVVWVLRRRRDGTARALGRLVAAACAAEIGAAAVLLCLGGASSRYIAEFWSGWTPVTAVGALLVFGGAFAGRWRWPLRGAAALAGIWTVGYVWMASADHGGILRRTSPAAYEACARILDYPSLWWARARGISFGPVDLQVRIPPLDTPGPVVLVRSGRSDRLSRVFLNRSEDGKITVDLWEDRTRLVLSTAPLAVQDGRVVIRLEAPWLYPPAESPYWDAVPDAAARQALQHRASLAVDGRGAVSAAIAAEDAVGFEPEYPHCRPSDTAPWVESVRPEERPGR